MAMGCKSTGLAIKSQDYVDRLDTAGDTTYTPSKQPRANYIASLVTLGGAYWDDLESSCILGGSRLYKVELFR